MNKKKPTSTFGLFLGAVVLTSFITFPLCHQMMLAPRDKVIKVLNSRLENSERIREAQLEMIKLLEQESEPKSEEQESSQQ
jgi:hypothetical protein